MLGFRTLVPTLGIKRFPDLNALNDLTKKRKPTHILALLTGPARHTHRCAVYSLTPGRTCPWSWRLNRFSVSSLDSREISCPPSCNVS